MNSNSSQHTGTSRYLELLVSLDSGSVDLLSQSKPFVLPCVRITSQFMYSIYPCTLLDPLYFLEVLSFTSYLLSLSWIVATVHYGLQVVITLSSCTAFTLCTLFYTTLVSGFIFFPQSYKDCT